MQVIEIKTISLIDYQGKDLGNTQIDFFYADYGITLM
jgi:hypothetical protein